MGAQKIDGKAVAAKVRADVGEAVKVLPRQPTLAVVLVGEDPASQVYVRSKKRSACALFTTACRTRFHRLSLRR